MQACSLLQFPCTRGPCNACFPSPALMQAACPIFPTVIKEASPGIPLCSVRTYRGKKRRNLWEPVVWEVFRKSHAIARWALVIWCHHEYRACSGWIVQQDVYATEHLWMSRILLGRKYPQSDSSGYVHCQICYLGKRMIIPFYFASFHYSSWKEESCYMKGISYCGAKVAVVQAGSHHSFRKVAICGIVLAQLYKIRPSNSSQSGNRKRQSQGTHYSHNSCIFERLNYK